LIFIRGRALSELEASPRFYCTGDLGVYFGIAAISISLVSISSCLWGVRDKGRDDCVTFNIVKLVVRLLKKSALAVDPDIDLLEEFASNNNIVSSSIT